MIEKNGDSTENMTSELSGIKLQLQKFQKKSLYFDLLIDSIPDSLYFKDKNSRFTIVNRVWMTRHEITDRESVVGKTDYDYFPKEFADIFFEDEKQIISTGKALIGKVEKIEIDGRPVRWATVSKFPVYDHLSNTIIGTFGISHDISALTEAEMALAHEREMFYLLLDHSNDAIYFKDLKSRYVRISRGHPALKYEKSPEDAIGKTDFDYFPSEHAQAAFNDEMQIIKTGKPILGKIERETASGMPEKWVFTSKLPIVDSKGMIIGTFGISRDITELKKYENELQKAKCELEERVRLRTLDLQKANADLQRRISQLDFITSASFQMAQCNDIHTLSKVILDSFSSILNDSVAALCIVREKEYECFGVTGEGGLEDLKSLFKSAIRHFSVNLLSKPVIIDHWTGRMSNADEWGSLSSFPYYIGIPLLADNRLVGIVQLFGGNQTCERFHDEKNVVLTLASQSAVSLSNALFQMELNEKAQLKGELEAARSIQQRLTPNRKPPVPGINLKGMYSPAFEVGGDYLDYFKNDLGYWVVVIADVCGKGVPAAMLMTLLRSSFRNEARKETSAKNLLCSVNDSMRVNLDERLFATSICLVIHPECTRMTYARAGHPRLIRITREGNVETINSNGIALGILSDAQTFSDTIDEVAVSLTDGDRFFIYTDGLTEAFNPQKATYGTNRLMKLLAGDIGNTPEEIIHCIIQDIKLFTQGAPYHDDLTFIAMCVDQNFQS
ncbi:MAG: SpoIIE family protein phosphatase [Chitinispirillaceae bacterium]|nr:SpoIIE family protein phosphatase [Chitinispirillaceae bacterium]